MPDNLFEQPDSATPLRPEEATALRVPVVDRRQLNEIEATNVEAGRAWAQRSRKDCFTADYLCDLHKRMFGSIWNWAGIYRTFDVNIGNTPYMRIAMEVRSALDDAGYWHVNQTYEPHELAIRLHHRLVLIHPFVNGNGRCTRMMADVVVKRLKAEPLTWGADSLAETGAARAAYVEALGAADNHDIKALWYLRDPDLLTNWQCQSVDRRQQMTHRSQASARTNPSARAPIGAALQTLTA